MHSRSVTLERWFERQQPQHTNTPTHTPLCSEGRWVQLYHPISPVRRCMASFPTGVLTTRRGLSVCPPLDRPAGQRSEKLKEKWAQAPVLADQHSDSLTSIHAHRKNVGFARARLGDAGLHVILSTKEFMLSPRVYKSILLPNPRHKEALLYLPINLVS